MSPPPLFPFACPGYNIIQEQDAMLKSRHPVKVYAAMQQQTYQTLDKESI